MREHFFGSETKPVQGLHHGTSLLDMWNVYAVYVFFLKATARCGPQHGSSDNPFLLEPPKPNLRTRQARKVGDEPGGDMAKTEFALVSYAVSNNCCRKWWDVVFVCCCET